MIGTIVQLPVEYTPAWIGEVNQQPTERVCRTGSGQSV